MLLSGTEFGRQKLAVKICSCPKRDKSKEEKNEIEKNESEPRSSISNESAPSVICAVNDGPGGSVDSNEHLRDIKVSQAFSLEFNITFVVGACV